MQENQKGRKGTSAILVVAIIVAFVAGFYSAKSSQTINIPSGTFTNATSGEPVGVDFSPFWKAWTMLDQNYVNATTTATSTQNRVWGAISGLTASFGDPYTVFFPPEQNQDFNDEINGSFDGVGLELGIQNDEIVVIAPLKGTPAGNAGIETGDILTKVNGTDISTITLDQVVGMIRGKAGTSVSVTIVRKGVSAPITFNLDRATINTPTIETSNSQSSISTTASTTIDKLNSNRIYLIALYTFTSDAANLFRDALKQFAQSGDHKLIIDLRGNPGGYLSAAVDMASWFLPSSDVVVREQYTDGHQDVYQSKGYDVFDNGNTDIVILVDGGSASASEIFSARSSRIQKSHARRREDIRQRFGPRTFPDNPRHVAQSDGRKMADTRLAFRFRRKVSSPTTSCRLPPTKPKPASTRRWTKPLAFSRRKINLPAQAGWKK